MKNKIKSILLLMLIVPCLFLFVACGKDNGNQNGSNNNNQTGNEDDSNVKSYSEGLAYVLSSDETYYIVTGIGSCEDSKVVIPSTYKNKPVKEIKAKAFLECDNLTSVNIPNSVTSIGNNIFERCSSLTSIIIGKGVTSIGDSAFSGCNNLQEMTLPFVGASQTEKTFLGYLFGASEYSKNSDYVPESLKKITITSATSIEYSAFKGCSSLTSITIPNSVTSIGWSAFENCSSLTSITIGNSVTSIEYSAFKGCSSLTSITIPNSVTSIGDSAFEGCSSLTSITIPNSVTSIGDWAFYGCSSLKYNIYDNAKYLGNNENPYLLLVEAINKDIITCTINSKTRFIHSSAFYGCSSLTSITIPNSVTSIGDSAFKGCSSLTSITIPNSVTSIGSSAFENCSSLTKVYYNGTSSDWNKISIDNNNSSLINATRYYYSETKPTGSGNYWHFDTDGTTILEW